MPGKFKQKNLSAQRKRNTVMALGLKVRPTGRIKRNSPMQVVKRNAVQAKGLPASATGKFRVQHISAHSAKVIVEKIKVKRTSPRVSGGKKRNAFGSVKTMGKRGTFQSRKSKRR
jgi:hypothetical protein